MPRNRATIDTPAGEPEVAEVQPGPDEQSTNDAPDTTSAPETEEQSFNVHSAILVKPADVRSAGSTIKASEISQRETEYFLADGTLTRKG